MAKCTQNNIEMILGEISNSGVTLTHFWVPVGDMDPSATPGKYGSGHVDILE